MSESSKTKKSKPMLTALDKSIQRGLADSAARRIKPAEEVFDRLEVKYRAMADAWGEGKRS